jgi:ABC-type multidrug transport system ATPase subunit
MLTDVGISKRDWDVRVEALSGGNRRRVMLGVAFVGKPALVFLDGEFDGERIRLLYHSLIANILFRI